jgi:hypothetical protein
VSRIAEEWKTGRVLRLNTVSEVNRQYADHIGVTDTPTFILFDSSGQELRRWSREAPTVAELP